MQHGGSGLRRCHTIDELRKHDVQAGRNEHRNVQVNGVTFLCRLDDSLVLELRQGAAYPVEAGSRGRTAQVHCNAGWMHRVRIGVVAALVTVSGVPHAARYCGANARTNCFASRVAYEKPTPRVNAYVESPERGTRSPLAIASFTFVGVR
jgi:hypothetical protein